MRKFLSAALVVALFVSMLQIQPQSTFAAGEGTAQFSIPTETLTQTTKTYTFDYPANMDRILGTGYSISGSGEITSFMPDSVARKLTFTVNSKKSSVQAKTV